MIWVGPQITVEGVDKAIGNFEDFGNHAYHSMTSEMRTAALQIQVDAWALAPTFDGHLRASIKPRFGADIGRLGYKVEVEADAGYAAYVEYGTRPHMPPVAAITPWAVAHGIDPWRLARHIAMYGTKPHPFMRPAFELAVPAFLASLASSLNEWVME